MNILVFSPQDLLTFWVFFPSCMARLTLWHLMCPWLMSGGARCPKEQVTKGPGEKSRGAISMKITLYCAVFSSFKCTWVQFTKVELAPLEIVNDETSGSSKTSVCFTELRHHQSLLRRCHNWHWLKVLVKQKVSLQSIFHIYENDDSTLRRV